MEAHWPGSWLFRSTKWKLIGQGLGFRSTKWKLIGQGLGFRSTKWKLIGQGLGFRSTELSSIESAPLLLASSHLIAMLENWLQWAPGDARGSTGYATLRSLKSAVDRAGLGRTAQEL